MPDIKLVKEAPRHLVGVRRSVPVTQLGEFFAEALPKVMGWVQKNGIQPASMPMAIWHSMDMQTGVADVQAGVFVAQAVQGEGDITPGTTAGGDILRVVHTGSYDTEHVTWKAAFAHAAELGRKPGAGWEIYIDDPTTVPEEKLRTEISLPLV